MCVCHKVCSPLVYSSMCLCVLDLLSLLCAALLLLAQCHNSRQLSDWCLHFISSNYIAFERREEFSQLIGDNLSYVQQHRSGERERERERINNCRILLSEITFNCVHRNVHTSFFVKTFLAPVFVHVCMLLLRVLL